MTQARAPLGILHGAPLALATVGVSLATFMQVLDSTIANVSVPTIAGFMGISATQGTWIITSFSVATAIAMPLTGRLAERIGQLRLFVAATVLFTVASLMCGLAPNMPTLVIARVIQGAVAGPLMPLSQALMLTIYPPHKRGHALALWATIAVVAPVVGPILGGYISDNASWPWIFFINVPVGIVAVTLIVGPLRHMESAIHRPPIDWMGLVLLVIWVGALQIMLDLGSDENWFDSPLIIALAVVVVVGLAYFLVWELGDEHPIVDLSLFRNRNFAVAAGAASLVYGAYLGGNVLLPLLLQTQLGYTATWAGLVLAPVGLAPIIGARFVGRHVHRFDPRLLITLSFAISAAVMWLRSGFTTGHPAWQFLQPQLLLGFSVLLMFTPLTIIMLSTLVPQRAASALGVSSFMRMSCAGLGTSMFTSLWQSREAVHHTRLVETLTVWDPQHTAAFTAAAGQGAGSQQGAAILDNLVSQQSFMLAADEIFRVTAVMLILLSLLLWLARPPFHALTAPVAAD
ncbi:MAG: DHA2 family efflux MFS transporter permease subunit [Proteobacteria bacterium]|nr:DHA2 family efflux MFS transporter permease subunit [Pseudomonadota bacterium]